jgi:two-component system LytT family sensor kinase
MRRARVWLAVLGCWTLLALLFASQTLLYYAYGGNRVSSWRVILPALADWYLWAALTPAIAWLAHRVPIVPSRWGRAALVHAPTSIAVAGAKLGARVWLGHLWPSALATTTFRNMVMAQFHLNLITYWVIAGLAQAVDHYRKYRDRELHASHLEMQLAQAQLDVLRMQLHPHFLFNTLHAISTLVRKDPERAERTIAQLSDLLRLTLGTIGRQKTTVKDELEFVDRYLAIQQTRFGDRLIVAHAIDPGALDALVPTQILQPLVENAVRHGIGPRASGGRVDIAVAHANGALLLRIADDGVGAPAGALAEGVGLANTRARLKELYGGDRLRVSTAPGEGFAVAITVPYERDNRLEPQHRLDDNG